MGAVHKKMDEVGIVLRLTYAEGADLLLIGVTLS